MFVNRLFKAKMAHLWVRMKKGSRCLDSIRQSQASLQATNYQLGLCCLGVSLGGVLASSFLTCGISYNLDGTEDVL